MEQIIRDMGLTFLIGAFTLLGFDYMWLCLSGSSPTGFFDGPLGLSSSGQDGRRPLTVWVFAFLALTVGIVAEDLTYRFSDTTNLPAPLLYNGLAALAPSYAAELGLAPFTKLEVLRKNALLKPDGTATSLGNELATRGAFSGLCGSGVASAETALARRATLTQTERSAITECGQQLYYHAKNISYRVPTYFEELSHIEARAAFARSCSILAFLIACATIVLWLPMAAYRHRRHRTAVRIVTVQVMKFVPVLLVVHFLGVCAYIREESEFDKRAFGYYSTSIASPLPSASIPHANP